jgi:hypothetical protein
MILSENRYPLFGIMLWAPVAPQFPMPDRHRFEIGECGLRPTGEARFMIEPLT